MSNENLPNINVNLNLNITDFLLLQEVSEMKLNRNLINDVNNPIRFYDNYKNQSFINDKDYRNQFYTAVGSQTDLDSNPLIASVGGAGAYTKIPKEQADYFLDNYDIVDYYGNDNTGFSATTFKNKHTGEITISCRSTEYKEDYYKDAYGADQEINNNGTAIAQNISLVNYLEHLKSLKTTNSNGDEINLLQTSKLNITGYSLGGHLASSAYQYLKSEGYSNLQLYVFNGPGVGNVSEPNNSSITKTENFGYLKQDLLNYINIINMFDILKLQNIDNFYDAQNFVNQNSNNQLTKDFFNSFSSSSELSKLNNLLFKNQTNTLLNTSRLNLYDINTNSYIANENELNKDSHISQNTIDTYLQTTIYGNDLYNIFKNYINNKYHLSKAGIGGMNDSPNQEETLIQAAQSEKTGIPDNFLFGPNALWINGQSTVNNYDFLSNDFNFVANSNRYANPVDIVIEDRPETEDGLSRLPVINSISQALNGDFGNTHSITLLNKSLNLMVTLAKLEGKNSIDVAKYSSIISSSSKERASHFYLSEDGSNGTGDSNAISNVLNTLSDLLLSNQEKQLIPFDTNINFDNSLGGWADINKINQLTFIEKKLINKTSNIKLVSFYNIKNEDLSRSQFNKTSYEYIKKEDLIQKAKINVAYRYALDKLNTFVIEDADYSNYKDSEHSEEWYSSRADVLLRIIDSNVENLNNYVSSNYTNDKPTQIFTNIYVNDNQQDVHFYSSIENKNVNYKTYNQNSYYYKSQTFNTISSLDSSLLKNIKKVANEININDVISSYPKYSALTVAGIIAWPVSFYLGASYLTYKAYKNYDTIKNITFDNTNISLNVANYFSSIIKNSNINELIGNITNRQSLSINNNIYFLDNSTSNYKSNNYKNKNENVFINVNKDLLFSYLNGDSTFENQYFNDTKYELKNGLSKPNTVDDIKLTHNINLRDGKDYIEITDDGVANIVSTSGEKTYNLHGDSIITDPDKIGTITLDGIVLDGGEFIFENGKISNYKTQKYLIKNANNTIESSITYELLHLKDNFFDGLLITNKLTNHKIAIPGMNNYGSTYTFNFKEGEKPIQTILGGLDKSHFSKEETNTITLNPKYNEIYSLNDNLDSIFNINIDIEKSNIVLNRLPNSKTDLFIYDKTNPNKNYTIQNYFNNDGSMIYHEFLLEHINDTDVIYTPDARFVKINNTYFSELSSINPTSFNMFEPINDDNILNQGYSLYELNFLQNNEFHYSKNSKFFIDSSIISNLTIIQNDKDLILSKNNELVNGTKYQTVIKNYFSFDHKNDSNFYFHSKSTGENKLATVEDLLKISTIKLDDSGVKVQLTTTDNTNSSVISGFGNDEIIGTKFSERFISSYKLVTSYDDILLQNNTFSSSDGNDIFTSGGGADEFIFSGSFGYDIINEFNNDSRVIINLNNYESNYQFKKNNNDLLIYQEHIPLNNILLDTNSSITIKDYFKNIDYLKDSRIIFNRDSVSQQDYFSNNDLLYNINYQFSSDEISYFHTTTIDDDKDLFEQNKKDSSDTTIDNTKLHSSYISGNDLDNTIIIRNNDTIIKPNQTSELTDGDDSYIIDIADTEALNPNHNLYRTTIQFGYNSGHDSLFNATFKETNQYGDIIELVNINSQSITINKIQNESNILVGFNVILSDGSSIALTLNDFSNSNIDVIKTNDKVIKLNELLTMASPNVISGDSLNNSFDLSSLDKSVNIKGMDGNDLIKGSKADDSIEGGNGFDQYNFSGGLDTYVFNQNCDIDTFNVNSISDSDINTFSANFLIDSSFKNNVSYLFNEKESEAYLKFSDTDGVVFTNVTWGKFINLINNINIKFTDNTTKSINVSETENFPFIKTAKIINGTTGSDYLQTNSLYSFVVYGKDGNDTIVSTGGTHNTRNFLFGGKGNDTITANDGDILVVKDGDGSDIVKTTDRSFVLEILHNTPRLVNSKETLFDISAVSGTNDIKLKYGSSTDVITIKDYFASTNNEVTVALYDQTNDKSYIYDDLDNILSTLKITKSSLLSKGAVTVYKTAVTADMIGNAGQLLGGELTAQYLAGNYLQDANKISHIIDNQLNGQPLQNKVYQ